MAVKNKKPQKKKPDPINPETGLSARQEEFCRQYVAPTATEHYPKLTEDDRPFNGTRAAIRAGYAKSAAAVTANRLIRNDKIQAFMADVQKPALDQFNITQERINEELAALAFSNILDFIHICDRTGQAWVDITKCSRQQAAALQAFEVVELPPQTYVEDGEEVTREVLRTKIKIANKMPALEHLAKREGMTQPDRVDVNVKQKIDEEDRIDMAKRIAFMLRDAAEKKKSKEQEKQ